MPYFVHLKCSESEAAKSVKSNGMISFTPTKIQPCLTDMPHPPEMFAKSFTDINIDIYIEHPALVLHQVLHYVI